ncbi:MAG TPA: protein kinase [Kofleriaceae bacterium]|jgi:serine/threonine protein kinase|nr:protein kinase [Kofleriaceae bacterium]
MAERQFGPYRLVRQIAVGGMAEIHLAKTMGIAGFEKYVALKMIHPNFAEDEQFIQMLVDEAKIAVQLNHANIAQTFDLGRVGEVFYITMEYVDGADLYKILRKASETDIDMPLEVAAYIAKEVASALDHAHKKRGPTGKSLGIVHRDVSPQNVLISYTGEVKLVDFGIAKATMKARQTAVGVIKGKYYYMSPEQAWGDPIDFRSDIFSAGIVLYEMITGQMLYLEEDLHKLLDMARKADIASPTTLRRGIPAQLERIVMHALARSKDDRYQSAADFATDLERFLHAYSPISTSSKVAALIKKVIGDPVEVPDEIEVRDGPISTHQLDVDDIVHSPDELRDENSMIFKLDDLKPPAPKPKPVASKPAAPKPVAKRDRNEPTREVQPAPLGPPGDDEDSGLLPMSPPPPLAKPKLWDNVGTDELDNINESTMVTGAPSPSFMMMDGDGIEATMVTGAPQPDDLDDDLDDSETITTREKPVRSNDDDGGPTVQRDFARSRRPTAQRSGAAPPALAAKIHAPALSELRKPKPSRKTPSAGVPNVLQQIVGSQRNEPMPAPSPLQLPIAPPMQIAHTPEPLPAPPAVGMQAPLTTPPPGTPMQMVPGVPPHLAPYQYGQPPQQQQPFGLAYPTVTPGSLYQLQHGQAPLSPTGQLRLFEVDELPPQYRMSRGLPQWVKVGFAGALAVSVAAGVTFFIIRSMQSSESPAVATVHVDSVPHGADVYFDGMHLAGTTPLAVPNEPAGKTIEIRVELAKHKTATEQFAIPSAGGDVTFNADLKPLTGKLVIVSKPDGADLYIDGRLRGRTPVTISDVDLEAKQVELRLKDYQPYMQPLKWPASGEIDIDAKLAK